MTKPSAVSRNDWPILTPARALTTIVSLLLAVSASWVDRASAFRIEGIFQIGPAHIGIAFSDTVNLGQALQLSRYAVTPQGGAPAVGLERVSVQENLRTVYLTTAEVLPASSTYAVAVTGLTSRHGDPLAAGGPAQFTTVAETVTGIADVHASINDLLGQPVTVIGQVFVRASTVVSGPSAYIQDATGRGLNVFGSPVQAAVDSIGTVAKVTGVVALYFTTVEITSATASALATHMPHIAPRPLTTAEASSPEWEGTYIQVTATLTAAPTPSGSSHYNYPASAGGVPFTYRVRNATGISPSSFAIGDLVTGAGAGSVFQGVYQNVVGRAEDFYRGTGPGDVTPPALITAEGEGGASKVTLRFTESVAGGAADPANYTIHPTGQPGSPLTVTTAAPDRAEVTLTLASALEIGADYTASAHDIADASGNVIAADGSVAFTATAPVGFLITGVFPFGPDRVGVGFTRAPNAGEALDPSHYAFAPPLAIAGAALQANGRTVILRTADPLPASTSYSVTVDGITSSSGVPLESSGPFAFATGAETVTSIEAIQANAAAYSGQSVTVLGQTYIPVGSRGGSPSGYIQDGTGHGINLYGGAVQGSVNQLGSVVRVTGTVLLYGTTVELSPYTATSLAYHQPHLGARRVTIPEANDAAWEGSYIEATGEVTAIEPSGISNFSYRVTDGTSSLVLKVANGLDIPSTTFSVGERITGRGAGASFEGEYQVLVGNRDDVFAESGGPDTTRPRIVSATGDPQSDVVTVRFSEAVRSAEATMGSNYRVSPAGSPGLAIAVTRATLAADDRTVTLTLASLLAAGVTYVVEVNNVTDLSGNAIQGGATATFTPVLPRPPAARLTGLDGAPFPAATLIRNLASERFRFEIEGAQDAKAVCRVFDLQGRLVKVLFDGKLTGTPRRALSWDGRDDVFELVPTGLYICLLETTDLLGHTGWDRAPIVVALRLE